MGREVEIKLRVSDLPKLRAALRRLKATVQIPRVHEFNELFDTPNKELMKREQLLRIRTEGSSSRPDGGKRGKRSHPEWTILTFKGPLKASRDGTRRPEKYKVREETELEVRDRRSLEKILQALGQKVWFRYEKYRTTYRLPRSEAWAQKLLIELDETPIGTFVELEGPARAIDRVAKALGYSQRDYIKANYFVVYRDECRRVGREVSDMLFARRRGW